jgi:hypothetical protein
LKDEASNFVEPTSASGFKLLVKQPIHVFDCGGASQRIARWHCGLSEQLIGRGFTIMNSVSPRRKNRLGHPIETDTTAPGT